MIGKTKEEKLQEKLENENLLEEYSEKYFITSSAQDYVNSIDGNLSDYVLKSVDISYTNSSKKNALNDNRKLGFIKKAKSMNAEVVVDVRLSTYEDNHYGCIFLMGTALVRKQKGD